MYKGKKIIALIPARGGSKGILNKNVRFLAGKPLIAWTIDEARKSRYLDSVIVSTDSGRIARVSRKHGAEVPFLRPAKLATDKAKMIDVIFHALSWFEQNSEGYDLVMLLQPTSPLRTADDIDGAVRELFTKNAKSIISVCEAVGFHPDYVNTLPRSLEMKDFEARCVRDTNRQELPKYYKMNGSVYLAYIDYVAKNRGFLGKESYAYPMPRERSLDIDDGIDLKFAEFLLKR